MRNNTTSNERNRKCVSLAERWRTKCIVTQTQSCSIEKFCYYNFALRSGTGYYYTTAREETRKIARLRLAVSAAVAAVVIDVAAFSGAARDAGKRARRAQ